VKWAQGRKNGPTATATPHGYSNVKRLLTPCRPSGFSLMKFKTWMCLICGFIYNEEAGLPDEGIAPGTRWEEVPVNWVCPECGARKEDFEMIEI
jgi:rubredoxin